jgi:hypothetical protein
MASKEAHSSAFEVQAHNGQTFNDPYPPHQYNGDVNAQAEPHGQPNLVCPTYVSESSQSNLTQQNGQVVLKGYNHLFESWTSWKWEYPNAYR